MRGMELCGQEREEISRGIAAELSGRVIAVGLGRDPSVVNREIVRNGGRHGYRADAAGRRAESRRRRPKPHRLLACARLHDAVAARLAEGWSPEQVSARLVRDHPDDEGLRVSHETIYQTLFLQARGELATQLRLALRTGRTRRRPQGSTRPKQARIAGMVNISERPAEVEDRAVPGHWEGDLIVGARGASQIATLVERTTRFLLLVKIPYDRRAERVAGLLASAMEALPEHLRRSLTWDQGVELADHARFSVRSGVPVYFCDPHSPWQRGTNENTNGLLREYFPKGTDVSVHSQTYLNAVADEMNGRPRKTLGWDKPMEAFNALLSSQE